MTSPLAILSLVLTSVTAPAVEWETVDGCPGADSVFDAAEAFGTQYVLPIAIRQTHDGAAYAIVTETARQDQCPGLVGANCWRSDLIRLAAD